MEVYYGNKKIKNNDFLTPNETSKKPKIVYEGKKKYSLLMIDPDAVHGTHIHWAVINIPGNKINKGQVLLPYQGPAPPRGTGYHRYFFMLFEYEKRIKDIDIEMLKQRTMSRINTEALLMMYKPKYKIMFVSKNEND